MGLRGNARTILNSYVDPPNGWFEGSGEVSVEVHLRLLKGLLLGDRRKARWFGGCGGDSGGSEGSNGGSTYLTRERELGVGAPGSENGDGYLRIGGEGGSDRTIDGQDVEGGEDGLGGSPGSKAKVGDKHRRDSAALNIDDSGNGVT